MIQVLRALYALQFHAFFQQKFVDVDDAAAGEYFFEAVFGQRVVTRSAGDDDGFDVEIIQGVGHAVEQDAVVGNHFVRFVGIAVGVLRVAAAQVAGRQHGLHADVPQHGLRGQPDLGEQAFRAAAGEVEHGFGIFRQFGVADDGDVFVAFDAEHGAGGLQRHMARQRAVHEVDDLFFDGRLADRGFRRVFQAVRAQMQFFHQIVAHGLHFEARLNHAFAHQVDGARVFGVQKGQSGGYGGVEVAFARLSQQVADGHGNVAEVDIDGAGFDAAVAHGAVVGHVVEFIEVFQRYAAAGLFFVQEGFGQKPHAQDFVARAVQQVGARDVGGADGFAFAAAQAVFYRFGDFAQIGLFHNQRFRTQQFERRGVGMTQIRAFHQLAAVEAAVRIDFGLVVPEGLHFFVAEEFEFGDADAVLAGNHAVQAAGDVHNPRHGLMRGLQHFVVV